MKAIINKVLNQSMKIVAMVAAIALYTSANSATSVWHGQPEAPEGLENYKIR